ncbi:hypothetical protein Pyn_24789 [Prunus yedoensis var. nudiflora]|uniref:Cyclic nucleotide-gated ion channel 1-like n=1 Tax=Prunus yedoensis var. nudiflora TaxID=2094558 RepID=A0A314YCR7_PRUYE|nr:hypothetical protein Pyn_24789 [Prunus yedoensis var. nudiflora]
MRGRLLTMTTNGGRTGFFNSEYLKAGDFCGEELLTWALDPHSSSNLPISTRTVQALSEVEAFALKADDLKFVASQFRRLHSKQLRHTFRLYSQQWRTWAACFIQAAWRRHCKKKLETSLLEEENRLQDALAKAGPSSPSLGATIYASRFAAKYSVLFGLVVRGRQGCQSDYRPCYFRSQRSLILLLKNNNRDFCFFLMEVQIPRLQGCDLEENAEEKFPKSNANGIHRSGKRLGSKNKFVNPQELVLLQRWNKILQVLCVVSLSLDPLYCYLLIVNDENKCLRLDTRLRNIAILLRSVIDFFHLFRIVFQFRASITIITPSQASGTGRNESVTEPPALVGTYLLLWFLLDILVILPLPQVVVFFIIPRLNDSRVFKATKSLNFIVILQYVLRVLRISSWLKKATRTSGILAETAGAKAAFNLFLYMLASHTYLQSKTARLEEMRLKGQEIELWMAFHSLPRTLKKRIRQYEKYKWQETRGVDVENFLHNLPRDLRRDTKRHLCSGPLSKVRLVEFVPPYNFC